MPYTVQLVQVNNSFVKRAYLPYVAGLLHAYAEQYAPDPERYYFRPYLHERLALDLALGQCFGAQIVAMSCYVWNIEYSLQLAKKIKALSPDTLILMGGPQIPDRAEAFLRQHEYVNAVSHGEGEALFLEFLEAYPENDWSEIAGLSYLKNGHFVHHPQRPRRRNLESLPSPYLTGRFDDLVRGREKHAWGALWETNRGCPFTCSYCDWGSATATRVNRFDMPRLEQEIEWFCRMGMQRVYCCDANYGMLKRDIELARFLIQQQQKYQNPEFFVIQSAKNVTERVYEMHSLLAQSKLSTKVTLSLQSLNPQALRDSARENISLEMYRELQARFRRDGVDTYTDLLIALPGETYESFLAGIDQVLEDGQHDEIRFYNVYLLPNAPMAQPEQREKYKIKTVINESVSALNDGESPVKEYQEMVVETYSLSRPDWRRARQLAWWVSLLLTSRTLQIPILLIRELAGISYRDILSWFVEGQWPHTEVMQTIRDRFVSHLQDMENGAAELLTAPYYELSGKITHLYHQVDTYILQGLVRSGAWENFYHDAEILFLALLAQYQTQLPENVLNESLKLSQQLAHPRTGHQSFSMPVQSNFWQYFQKILRAEAREFAPWTGELYRENERERRFTVQTRGPALN